ncbi:MAG: hypothetical protein ACO3BC_09090 [Ilumatobacteraceae bacterium]
MTENIDPRTDPQFKALMQVMNDITQHKVPIYNPWELAARSTLRKIQHEIDDRNVLDDGELIDTLNQTRIEIKYLLSIISDLDARVKERDAEVNRLEKLAHRAY